MTESDLIRKAQEGDEMALSSIFGGYESKLRGVASKILKNDDDVDDALQTVRIKVWQKIGTFNPDKGTKLSTWLHTITKNTCLDQKRNNKAGTLETEKENEVGGEAPDPRYKNKEGGPPIEVLDAHLQTLIAKEVNPHELARRKIKTWPDDARRRNALRIVMDSRITSFTEELRISVSRMKGTVTMSHFILILMWAADCSEPYKEVFTPEEARTTVKLLEYFGGKFHDAPAGSGLEAMPGSIETLLRLLRPVANRPGTKTIIHQYDLINRLDHLFGKICGPRLPDTAIRILLEITYGGKWTPGKLASMRTRAREVFPT